ncbi:MAG TPA: YbjN domain-containing protein [Mobilitalea sp.]|nr:YbjN domain-containing protein [Mobilitalea sp.]
MGEALSKKRLFEEALAEAELEGIFEVIELDDAYGFRAVQNIKNGRALLLVILDESIYATGSITFATLDDLSKKEKILRLFNELNAGYKNTKFFISDDNELICQMSYVALAEDFRADVFLRAFINLFKTLADNDYAKIMRVLWS